MENIKSLAQRIIDIPSIASKTEKLDHEFIEQLIHNIHVSTPLLSVTRGVTSRILTLVSKNIEDEEIAKELEKRILKAFNFNDFLNKLALTPFYGYSVHEKIYDTEYGIAKLEFIPYQCLKYDKEKGLMLKGKDKEIKITPDKFLVSVFDETLDRPLGKSLFEYGLKHLFEDLKDVEAKVRGLQKKYGDIIPVLGYFQEEIDELSAEEVEEFFKNRSENYKGMLGKDKLINAPIVPGSSIKEQFQYITLSDLKIEIHNILMQKYESKIEKFIKGAIFSESIAGSQAKDRVQQDEKEKIEDHIAKFMSSELSSLIRSDAALFGYKSEDFYFQFELDKGELELEKVELEKIKTKRERVALYSDLNNLGYKINIHKLAFDIGLDIKDMEEIKIDPIIEFASKKKDLNSLLELNRSAKKKVLEQAENAFLEKFTKDIKKQIQEWSSNITESNITALNLNFNTFIEHQTIVELMARIKLYKENSTIEFEEEINPFELKFEDAIKFALDKNPLLFDKIDEITETVRANAFWIKRLTELNAVEKLMKELQISIEAGGTFKDWLKNIDEVINKAGLGKNGWYLENVYRTNSMSFYNAGAYKEQEDNIENQPYGLYDGVGDDRQTSICKELDGKVYLLDDPIWNNIYPPNHYQCRSGVIALSEEDLEDYEVEVSVPSKLVKNLELGTFKGNPGKNYFKNLEKAVKDKEKNPS